MGRFADFFREQSITLAGQQKQKMLSLDREFEDIKAKRDVLEAENLKLQANVNPLKRQVEQLADQIQRMQAESARAADTALDEKAEALLLAIAQRFHISEGGSADIIQVTQAKAEYYLGLLTQRRLIKFTTVNYGVDGRYLATQKGLEYLNKIGKL